jgi:hypothetical protein
LDTLVGTAGNNAFIGIDDGNATTTSSLGDSIDGGAGIDTVRIISDQAVTNVPTLQNVENLILQDSVHEARDFSGIAGLSSIELDTGTTVNGADIAITLGADQSLTLDSVTDGDAADDTDDDGDIDVTTSNTDTSVALILDGVGAQTGLTAVNDLDIVFTNNALTSASIAVTGTNNVSLTSGAALDALTITGAGNLTVQGALNAGLNTITSTATGNITLATAGGNDTVNTGTGNDNITTGAGNDAVNTGAGNDTVNAAGNFTTADTFDGGDGVDTFATTTALTDALVGDLSNFEILDIGGSANVTHDLSNFTTLTVLEVDNAATGAGGNVVITDLAKTASVRINAALGDGLVLNQINSTIGSPNDKIVVDFANETSITTGQELQVNAIEGITINSTSTGTAQTHVLSNLIATSANTLNVNATSAAFTITNISDAAGLVSIDLSGSTANTNITSNDGFTTAFLYKDGAGADVFDATGATVVTGTTYEVNTGLNKVTFEGAGVSTEIQTTATVAANAFEVVTFVSTEDKIDYNGALLNGTNSTVVASSAATFGAAITGNANATVFGVTLAAQNVALETAMDAWLAGKTAGTADALEAAAVTALGAQANLDANFLAGESVLISLDNDSAGVGGNDTAIFRFTNTTGTGNTIDAGELQLVGFATDLAVVGADFI